MGILQERPVAALMRTDVTTKTNDATLALRYIASEHISVLGGQWGDLAEVVISGHNGRKEIFVTHNIGSGGLVYVA